MDQIFTHLPLNGVDVVHGRLSGEQATNCSLPWFYLNLGLCNSSPSLNAHIDRFHHNAHIHRALDNNKGLYGCLPPYTGRILDMYGFPEHGASRSITGTAIKGECSFPPPRPPVLRPPPARPPPPRPSQSRPPPPSPLHQSPPGRLMSWWSVLCYCIDDPLLSTNESTWIY